MVRVVWAFIVRPGAAERFEQAYGPNGPWVCLFARFAGYRGTTLSRDIGDLRRYLTVDRWETLEQWKAMRSDSRSAYSRIDRELAGLTDSEVEVGIFATVG